MPTISSNPRKALAHALTNDRNGKVSTRDAQAIVDAAVKDIERAKDPAAAFDRNRKVIDAASVLAQDNQAAARVLSSYGEAGTNAVNVRLQGQTGPAKLPGAALTVVKEAVEAAGGEGSLKISDVKGSAEKGFSFHYAQGGVSGNAFAVKHGERYVVSPVKVSAQDLEKAASAFKAYFNENIAPEMKDYGASASEIAAARRALTPERALLKGESDPQDLVDSYPLVFTFPNETGSDHGYYLGFNPETGESEPYTFN